MAWSSKWLDIFWEDFTMSGTMSIYNHTVVKKTAPLMVKQAVHAEVAIQ